MIIPLPKDVSVLVKNDKVVMEKKILKRCQCFIAYLLLSPFGKRQGNGWFELACCFLKPKMRMQNVTDKETHGWVIRATDAWSDDGRHVIRRSQVCI